MGGSSPKFACVIPPDDQVKVKYGGGNGEAYAEVAATRLLWTIGFGADRMYPVKVICHGCSRDLEGGTPGEGKAVVFDTAAIERKMHGREVATSQGEGWAWPELDLVDEEAGGAPRGHRDALKLLAAMLQHTDSKPDQQRFLCLDENKQEPPEQCTSPFLIINDLGLTFGKANPFNEQERGSVNFDRWASTSVWRDRDRCVANLHKSLTGTLEDPRISEAGRQFLAGLLAQLSDGQLHDLFDVAGFSRRAVQTPHGLSRGTVDEWVGAFKKKRDEIETAHCEASEP